MGRGIELHMCDWKLDPLAKHGSQKRSKGTYGQHWPSLVGRLDTPTGFWRTWDSGGDVWNRACWKAKRPLVPTPTVGGMSTVTCHPASSGLCGPVSGSLGAQLWKDAWSRTVTGDQLSHLCSWYFWVGKERGSWLNFELSWQRVPGWFFFGCLRGDGLWGKSLPLFPKTLVVIVSTVNRFLFLCYFQSLNLCSSCNETIFDVVLWLFLSPYFCYPDILGRNLPLSKRFFLPNSIFGDLPGRQWAEGPTCPRPPNGWVQ